MNKVSDEELNDCLFALNQAPQHSLIGICDKAVDGYIMDSNKLKAIIEELKELRKKQKHIKNFVIQKIQMPIIEYCKPHLDQMWAAKIVGIMLDCDFRDSKEMIKSFESKLDKPLEDASEL